MDFNKALFGFIRVAFSIMSAVCGHKNLQHLL